VSYRVILTPEAEEQIQEIQAYITSKSFPQNAANYVHRLVDHIEGIATAPFQGASREDIGPGFRTTGFERRVTILYAVRDEEVIVAGIYHGGQQVPKSVRL
jgi:toxin ParE1/3/4